MYNRHNLEKRREAKPMSDLTKFNFEKNGFLADVVCIDEEFWQVAIYSDNETLLTYH